MTEGKNTERVTTYLSVPLELALRRLAEDEGMKLAQYIRKLCRRHVITLRGPDAFMEEDS